jgi:putative ABC transport system permease protein
MLAATLRGMVAHKLRLVLTTASIALGVAFLAGTLILTDTMKLAFDQLFGKIGSGTDAVVRTEASFDQSEGVGLSRAPIASSVLDQVRAVDGVRVAEGSVTGYALLTDTEGRAVLTSGGAPTQGYNLPKDVALRGDVAIRSGRAPEGPGEVVIDATSSERKDIPLGSDIKILFRGPTRTFTVVGTVAFGGENDLGGTTSAYFDTATAQNVLGSRDTFDAINVRADDGVTDAALAKRLDAAVPDTAEAVTGAQVAQETADAVNEDLKMVSVMFMIFAGIALFVGSFIIWNTFTMIVTQRSREIALLRAVGATRRQIRRSLLTEALLLGVASSAVGVGLGVGVAKGLNLLMSMLGFSLPTTSLQIAPRTIWLSILVGTVVTVVAALVPARRATKVLPVEALREATPGSRPPSKRRLAIGALTLVGGVAAVLSALYGDGSPKLLAVGVPAALVGVITLAPVAAGPLAALLGWPLRLRGVPGELARQNAMRNPRRTASTATALMIGLTLVVSMGVFASSLKASFSDILSGSTHADLYLSKASAGAEGFSPEATRKVAAVPGVRAASATAFGQGKFAGADTFFTSIDPATAEQTLSLDVSAGSVEDLGADAVLVAKKTAEANGWQVGSTVPVEFASTGKHDLRVAGIFDQTGGFVESDYLLSLEGQDALAGDHLDASALVLLDEGVDKGEVKAAITAALADHPDAKILDQEEYEKEATGFIDKLLTFVSVMLLLAVVIALLGIVNTLALSVFERTRELGLLRAVGMTRAQVREMVRWESVVISLIGAGAGAVLGIGLGLVLAQALKSEGIEAVSVPWPSIAMYVVAAAVAGMVAAIGPARSASRVDVLKAVVTD